MNITGYQKKNLLRVFWRHKFPIQREKDSDLFKKFLQKKSKKRKKLRFLLF